MGEIEKGIIEIIKKHFWIVILVLGLTAGVWVRLQGMAMVTDDYLEYLKPWHDTLKENTGFKGLAMDFYTYYIPYMCILAIATYFDGLNLLQYIKVISIISEFICALLAGLISLKLMKSKGSEREWSAVLVLVLLLSPMIVLNGAYWGQCDYIYIAFALLSILLLYSEKYNVSFICLGIAFCFKIQTIFLFPAYLLFYICNKKFSIWKFIYVPLAYLLAGLPAIIAGRPAKDVYSIYLGQANLFKQLSMNTPNIWRLFPNLEYEDFYKWGIALTIAIFCILAFIVFRNDYELDGQTFLMACVCSAGICVMFLPGMHERYTGLYCLLAYMYFLIYDRKKVLLAVIIDLITCMSYFLYLYGMDVLSSYRVLAVINLGVLLFIIYDTIKTMSVKHAPRL